MFGKSKEVVASPEGALRLKALKVEARSVGEAMDKQGGGAGQEKLDWVLDPANYKQAKKMLKAGEGKGGVYYFFPEAGAGEEVPCVREGDGRFWRSSSLRDDGWVSGDRVVV